MYLSLFGHCPKLCIPAASLLVSDDTLTTQYYEECALMANRIMSMRTQLVEQLKKAGSTHDWSHVTSQIGMFAYTTMNSDNDFI